MSPESLQSLSCFCFYPSSTVCLLLCQSLLYLVGNTCKVWRQEIRNYMSVMPFQMKIIGVFLKKPDYRIYSCIVS